MNVLGVFNNADTSFWWITIGLGAVVDGVVVVLLSLLLSFCFDADGAIKGLLATAGGVAQNTGKASAINQTAELGGVLRDELGRHAALLKSLGEA